MDINPYIYCITNLITRERYVGQHNGRNKNYMGSGNLLLEAYKFYGIENFTKEILEYCTISELDSKERYWILKLNTYEGVGYNKTPGGEKSDPGLFCRGPKKTPVLQYDLNGILLQEFESQIAAADALNIPKSCINDCIRGRQKTAGGYIFKIKSNFKNAEESIFVDLTHKNKNKKKPESVCKKVLDLNTGIVYRSTLEVFKNFKSYVRIYKSEKEFTNRTKHKLIYVD